MDENLMHRCYMKQTNARCTRDGLSLEVPYRWEAIYRTGKVEHELDCWMQCRFIVIFEVMLKV